MNYNIWDGDNAYKRIVRMLFFAYSSWKLHSSEFKSLPSTIKMSQDKLLAKIILQSYSKFPSKEKCRNTDAQSNSCNL